MKDSQFGICEWCLAANGPSAIKTAGMTGFAGIQISDLGGMGKGFPLLDPRIQSQYLEAAEQSNVIIHSLHTHALTREGGMRRPIESSKGKDAVISFKNAVKACVQMGIGTIMVASFDASGVNNDYDLENTAIMLSLFSEVARDSGVSLTYEGVMPISRVLRILEKTNYSVKICFDVLNGIRFGHGHPCEELKKLSAEMIDHIHLKDAPNNMEGCCTLGEGSGSFNEVVKTINNIKYTGWFFSENYYYLPPMNQIDASGTELAEKDLEIMKRSLLTYGNR
jgi:sugar phosphate isomerase/epimerase